MLLYKQFFENLRYKHQATYKQKSFRYSQVICGTIRGALEMMHMEVQTSIVSDLNQNTEIRVKFIRILHDTIPPGEED